MEFVTDVVKEDLNGVMQVGRFMIASLFALAVLTHYLGIFHNNSNWSSLLLRLVVGFVLLQNYVWIMDTTKDIVIGLDAKINPNQDFVNQYVQMVENVRAEYEESIQQNFTTRILDFGKNTVHNLIINFSFIFYAIVSRIMEAIRYSVVGIMYKLGPVLIPLILFNSTKRVLNGWFTSYVSVLSWPILWHITLSIAVAISERIGVSGEGIEQFVALNFAIGFILVFSPMIITSLAAGIGAGGAVSLAGAFATKMALDTMKQGGRVGVAGLAGAAGGVAGAARTVSQKGINPSVTLGERVRNMVSNAGHVTGAAMYGGIKNMANKTGLNLSKGERSSLWAIRKKMKTKKKDQNE